MEVTPPLRAGGAFSSASKARLPNEGRRQAGEHDQLQAPMPQREALTPRIYRTNRCGCQSLLVANGYTARPRVATIDAG